MNTKHIARVLEISYVILIIGIFLWTSIGSIWDHKIQHPFPYGYLATDAFQHQTRTQWIKDAGNYKYEGPYYSAGYKDITGFYPPIIHHNSILLSYTSGLEVFDTIYFLNFFFVCIGILIMYLIIRNYSKYIAIMALPLPLFIFKIKGAWVALLWGHWPAILGNFFLIAACWALLRFELKKSYLLVGLFIAGTSMAHTASTIFAGLFLIFYTIINLLKGINKKFLIKIALSILIFLIIAFSYLIIFQATWMQVQPFKFHIKTDFEGGGGFVALKDFGWFMYLILIGAILSILLVFKNKGKEIKKIFVPALSLFILFMGYTNYIGFERRAFNLRYYWPLFLSFFVGLALYFIIVKYTKKQKLISSIAIGLVIIFVITSMAPKWNNNQGIMNKYVWDTENWIKDNLPEDVHILFWYGDFYDQNAHMANTKHFTYRIDREEFMRNAQKNIITRNYSINQYIEVGGGLPIRESFFKFRLLSQEKPEILGFVPDDVCRFDYFVFDKVSRIPDLAKFNLIIANKLKEKNSIEKVFENDLNVIFKNVKQGGGCL